MEEAGPAAKKLKALREESGLSVNDVARAIGRRKSSYAYYEDEYKKDRLPPDLVGELIPVFEGARLPGARERILELGLPLEIHHILPVGRSPDAKPNAVVLTPNQHRLLHQRQPVEVPAPAEMPLDVPVYGTAMGGEGADFDFNAGEVVDRVRRPPGLANASKAFALYVVGESMSPRYDAGDLIFVHPGKPAVPGCDVVVELHQVDEWGSHRALLKTFRGKTPTKLLLEQLNPAGPVEIPLGNVKQLLRVLRTHELMGV